MGLRDPEEFDRGEISSKQLILGNTSLVNCKVKRLYETCRFVGLCFAFAEFLNLSKKNVFYTLESIRMTRSQSDARPTIFPALPLIRPLLRNFRGSPSSRCIIMKSEK